MIYFNNVTKKYRDNMSLENVTFSVSQGEFVSIVGHSGAGKTTLTKLILAEEYPTEGTVFFESIDIHKLSNSRLTNFRRRVGVVFQDFRLLANKTAYENVAFAMEAIGKNDSEIKEDVPHVLELVDLANRASHFPHQLSGGEKQRLAIARAIITQPELIIADEPTGNLDPINTNEVVNILKKINDLGTTVILTTHNRSIIDQLKKRVITLESGRIIRDDKDGKYMI
ncbi:MAG TPA: cell division ATP-binding protein FtsE [Candidatus Paceibacterota bacterium]|jgi:cell division transport system ATP-binding protein|nr:cell division ATP-binding protein FtsE [Candidatus Paceibacterota bacterium]